MSVRCTGTRLGWTLAACGLLAGCAMAPPRPPATPATVVPRPQSPPTSVAPLPKPAAPGEPWSSLTASFAMHDCNDSPLVQAKLADYTRSPAHFEQMLQRALPLMMYVQHQLRAAGVPGEFVMLPMLESSYAPSEPSRRGDPAGMWQLMPATARRHGITITHKYDGRLDPVASTRVAVSMLSAFGKRFDDWRLVDLAYSAGPDAIADAVRRHPNLGDAAIPDIPIPASSRNHLAKLMALSCILREPQRFHVKLPKPSAADRLTTVGVPAGLELRDAAAMAKIPEAKLKRLNPGYLGTRIAAHSPGKLLLPQTAADALAAALAADRSDSVAEVDTPEPSSRPGGDLPLPAERRPPPDQVHSTGPASARAAVPAQHHRVRKGEALWSIAQRYGVSVGDLKRWNGLRGNDIEPGQELRVHR